MHSPVWGVRGGHGLPGCLAESQPSRLVGACDGGAGASWFRHLLGGVPMTLEVSWG